MVAWESDAGWTVNTQRRDFGRMCWRQSNGFGQAGSWK